MIFNIIIQYFKKYFAGIKKNATFANELIEAIRKMFDGVVAQLVEQRTENPCVTGSIPVNATRREVQNECFPFLLNN